MSRLETEQYIKYRLLIAGAPYEPFEETCYDMIHAHTGGICREVSKLADTSLMEAFLQGTQRVTPEIMQRCVNGSI
jgi:type II secretory pathway predicted ATPase ExeA